MANDVERDPNDIWYELDPFVPTYECDCGRIKNHEGFICEFCNSICRYVGDMRGRYKGEIQSQLTRERFFNGISESYFNSLLLVFSDNLTLRHMYLYSTFLRNYIVEILNRLCLECEFVRDVEINPRKYKNYHVDDCLPPIRDYLDWLINICRFGKYTVERMVDTVEQEKIDEFITVLSQEAAALLISYIISHA